MPTLIKITLGRLLQIEYAMERINKEKNTVGIMTAEGVVLGTEREEKKKVTANILIIFYSFKTELKTEPIKSMIISSVQSLESSPMLLV
jgi:hypothetical protein